MRTILKDSDIQSDQIERQNTEGVQGIVDLWKQHLARLTNTYASMLTDYQVYEKKEGRHGFPLIVWQFGDDIYGSGIAKVAADDCALQVQWFHFGLSENTRLPSPDKYGELQYIPAAMNFIEWIRHNHQNEFPFSVQSMNSLLKETTKQWPEGANRIPWPDVIVSHTLFGSLTEILESDSAADENTRPACLDLPKYMNFFFHLVEPGGILIALESRGNAGLQLREFMKRNKGDVSYVGEGEDIICSLYKEPNIYLTALSKIHLGSRKEIFDEKICRDVAIRSMTSVQLEEGSRILDVGIGDGRFSQHIASIARLRNYQYEGIEASPHPSLHPDIVDRPELKGKVTFNTNFFAVDAPEQYGAIFLLFVIHSFKHWQLYLYKAWQLLQPGGYLIVSFREDNFSYWVNGIFSDDFASPVREAWKKYWDERNRYGMRNPEQMLTAISANAVRPVGEEMGFKLSRDPIIISSTRKYHIERSQLCPTDSTPAHWNIAHVGITADDKVTLDRCLCSSGNRLHPRYEDFLYETVTCYVFQKNR